MDDRKDWSRWLEAAGVNGADVTHGPVMNRASMVIDAAINGQGVALARTTLAAWDLLNGKADTPVSGSAALVQELLDHLPQGDGCGAQGR